jgi:hypothetical protein
MLTNLDEEPELAVVTAARVNVRHAVKAVHDSPG